MKLKISKRDFINYAKNILLVIFGTAVLAFGAAIFLIPFDLVTGGISGLGIVCRELFHLI